jgi:FtsP/CotA-like multicopper oxidase with cupredoxin domain
MSQHRNARSRRLGVVGLVVAAAIGTTSLTTTVAPTAAASGISEGLLCTRSVGTPAGRANFALTAQDGTVNVPDGNSMVMWSYSNGNGLFQFPGPVLCVNEGDRVTITLRNRLQVRTSMMFLGIDGVQANGLPAQAQFDGGLLRSQTTDVAVGGSITYAFTAAEPGTYLYQSGNDQELQVEMGLFGALIVYPSMTPPSGSPPGAAYAYDDVNSLYNKDHEYLVLLSELDPDLHYAVEESGVLTAADYAGVYAPRYFMINGRSFPDTIAPNNAGWLPNQPYGALAEVQPAGPGNPLPALIRYLAVGAEPYPFHPHSNHERVIAKDGRMLNDGGVDLSLEKFAIVLDPGSTADATFRWTNVEDYKPSNPTPVPAPNGPNMTEGEYYSGSPYLGSEGVLNPEVQAKNQCGEYYHVAHNHNLAEATNYGAAFGGQLTLIRVDPPAPNNCGNG